MGKTSESTWNLERPASLNDGCDDDDDDSEDAYDNDYSDVCDGDVVDDECDGNVSYGPAPG